MTTNSGSANLRSYVHLYWGVWIATLLVIAGRAAVPVPLSLAAWIENVSRAVPLYVGLIAIFLLIASMIETSRLTDYLERVHQRRLTWNGAVLLFVFSDITLNDSHVAFLKHEYRRFLGFSLVALPGTLVAVAIARGIVLPP